MLIFKYLNINKLVKTVVFLSILFSIISKNLIKDTIKSKLIRIEYIEYLVGNGKKVNFEKIIRIFYIFYIFYKYIL